MGKQCDEYGDSEQMSVVHSEPNANTIRLFVCDKSESAERQINKSDASTEAKVVRTALASSLSSPSPNLPREQRRQSDDLQLPTLESGRRVHHVHPNMLSDAVCDTCKEIQDMVLAEKREGRVRIVNVGTIFDKYNSDETSTNQDATSNYNALSEETDQPEEDLWRDEIERKMGGKGKINGGESPIDRPNGDQSPPDDITRQGSITEANKEGVWPDQSTAPASQPEIYPNDGSPERYPYDPTYNSIPHPSGMAAAYPDAINEASAYLESTTDTDVRHTAPADMSLNSLGYSATLKQHEDVDEGNENVDEGNVEGTHIL